MQNSTPQLGSCWSGDTVRDGSHTFQQQAAMTSNLDAMLDPEHLAQQLPGAIYLAAPYTAEETAIEQARVQAVPLRLFPAIGAGYMGRGRAERGGTACGA